MVLLMSLRSRPPSLSHSPVDVDVRLVCRDVDIEVNQLDPPTDGDLDGWGFWFDIFDIWGRF